MASRKMSAAQISAATDAKVLEAELRRAEENPADYKPSEARRLRERIAELGGSSPAADENPVSRPATRPRPARGADARPAATTRVTRTRRTTNGARGARTTDTVTETTTQVGTAAAPAAQPAGATTAPQPAAATPAPGAAAIVIPPAPPTPPATPAAQPACPPQPDDRPSFWRRIRWGWVAAIIILLLAVAGLFITPLVMSSQPPEMVHMPGITPERQQPAPTPDPPQGPTFNTPGPSQLVVESQPQGAPGLETFTWKECRRHYFRNGDYDVNEFWYADAFHGESAPRCHDHPRDSH